MTIEEQQREYRQAFVGGGPGALVSGCVWLAAAWVAGTGGLQGAFTVLFFGGMLIFPLSALACRLLFGRRAAAKGNVLGGLALESTVAMIAGLFVAWLFFPYRAEFVFPVAAIAVGTHYLPFRTIYGDRLFWLLGGLIAVVGVLGIVAGTALPAGPILWVGVVELLLGSMLTVRAVRGGQHSSVSDGGAVAD